MKQFGDFYTPDELADEFEREGKYGKLRDRTKEGGPSVEQQHAINRAWLIEVFKRLKVGGIWAWPESRQLWKKVDAYHLREVVSED